jgi:THAP4-like, heme-binding beta-barrel domain
MEARQPNAEGSARRPMTTPSFLHEDLAELAFLLGVTEVAVGTVDGGLIELSSTAVSLAPTASPVTELRRRIQGRGDELSFELQMAMDGAELQWHVGSKLTRA